MKGKILSGTLAFLFLVLTACAVTPKDPSDGKDPTDGPKEYHSEIPDYSACDKVFYVGAFGEPRKLTYDTFKDAADLGVTHMYIDPWFNGTSYAHPDVLQKAFELCDDVGMKGIIMCDGLSGRKDYMSYKDYVAKVIENSGGSFGEDFKMTDWRGFGGFIFDEPLSECFPFFVEDYAKYKVDYPDSLYLINMCASDTVYTNPDELFKHFSKEVLSGFEDNSRIFTIDSYPFTHSSKDDVYRIGVNHAAYTELASHWAKEANAPFYAYVQTMATGFNSRCPDCIEDVRWQVGCNLAFGARGIELFTYSYFPNDEFSGTCCVSVTGDKEETYYFFKQVFDEMHNWQKVYLSYDYLGTMVVDTDAISPNADDLKKLVYTLDGHKRIKNVSAQRDLLIGAFKDKDGYDGFLFNSYTDTYYKKYNEIRVEFNDASRVLYFINGEEKVEDLTDGVFEYEMECGDILFAIPLK